MLMLNKKLYLQNKLELNDLNTALNYFGHPKQKNKKDAEKSFLAIVGKMDHYSHEHLADYLFANKVLQDCINFKDFVKYLSRKEMIDAFKTLIMCDFLDANIFFKDSNITGFGAVKNLEEIIEDFEDDELQEILMEFDEDYFEYCHVPKEAIRKYFFSMIGVEYKNDLNNLGDEIKITSNYNLDLLNMMDVNPHAYIEKLKKVQTYLKIDSSKEFEGYANIFEGPSGVGKTEYAKYIASVLGQHFTYTSYGGLSSGYHGETESNIKNFFDEAREKNSLIFIDEADSFFYNRQNATQGFEISIVNEMLQQIEKYPGIVICSTNLLPKMDHAALRRFAEKITFNYLTKNQAKLAFEIYFKKQLSELDSHQLDQIKNLSLGDFKVVRQKTFFEDVSNKKHLELLLSEVNFRSRIK